jgi:ACS family allantoate permease-like MFS transporter
VVSQSSRRNTIICLVISSSKLLTISRWRTSEQPLRIGLWITGTSLGSIIGQSIDFAAVNIGGTFAHSPWKWIYVILGSVSIGSGLFMLWAFPDSPMKATFLTEREKHIAVQRVQDNNTGMQSRTFKWHQVREAFMDPQMYIICIFGFCFAFANAALGR